MMHPARYALMLNEQADKIGGDDNLQDLKYQLLQLADEFMKLSAEQSKLMVRVGTLLNLGLPKGEALEVLDEMYEQRSYGR